MVGRTQTGSTRRVVEAVREFNTGAQWHMLPQSYPNYKAVHRRFQSGATAKFCVES